MPFPLLSLPINELVLHQMDDIDKISFSFCSKQAKVMVKNLKLEAKDCEFLINDTFTCSLDSGSVNFDFTELFKGESVNVRASEETQLWKIPNFNIRDWILHFSDVFFGFNITKLEFDDVNTPFDDELQNIFKGIDIEIVEICIRNKVAEKSIKKIISAIPKPERLEIFQEASETDFKDETFMRQLSLQNYNAFRLFDTSPDYFRSLESVLSTNACAIVLSESSLKMKDINRLLKLWMRGAMRNLEIIAIEIQNRTNQDDLLRGTNPVKTKRERRVNIAEHCRFDYIIEGIGIKRKKDGVCGIIDYGIAHDGGLIPLIIFNVLN